MLSRRCCLLVGCSVMWLLAWSVAVAAPPGLTAPPVEVAASVDVAASVEVPAVDVEFTAEWDGTLQRYVMCDFRDAGAATSEAADVLIALHGHGSDRWQFIRSERDEVRAAIDFARQQRMVYISPDYRAPTSWMGPAAEADLKQIVLDLKQQYSLRRVFLCGGSMGATSALAFAAMHPQLVDGVAAMNGAANLLESPLFPEAMAASYGGTPLEVFEIYKQRSAEYWPERLTMPIGLTVDLDDAVVPSASVIRLAGVLQRLQRPVRLVQRPQANHATSYEDASDILKFMLQPEPSH